MVVTLITGGQSSGKSAKALDIALANPQPRAFIATAQPFDEEMKEKIRRHVQERQDKFSTIEEPLYLPRALEKTVLIEPHTIIIDCLTLWVSNLLLNNMADHIDDELSKLGFEIDDMRRKPFLKHLVIVTNEVGCGIIPENALSRKYVALLGKVNKAVAKISDEVILMVCGIPSFVKRLR
jgi:adenosylcobinamide kinase/adenosylcobinamide-phosphate guanylyltransferase